MCTTLCCMCQPPVDAGRRGVQGKTLAELESLALTAGQVLDDMEGAVAIADVTLLCRVALAHEVVYGVIEEKAPGRAEAVRPARANLQAAVAGFVKELVRVPDRARRQVFIRKCAPARRDEQHGASACCASASVGVCGANARTLQELIVPCKPDVRENAK
jgi:hypothetical protein